MHLVTLLLLLSCCFVLSAACPFLSGWLQPLPVHSPRPHQVGHESSALRPHRWSQGTHQRDCAGDLGLRSQAAFPWSHRWNRWPGKVRQIADVSCALRLVSQHLRWGWVWVFQLIWKVCEIASPFCFTLYSTCAAICESLLVLPFWDSGSIYFTRSLSWWCVHGVFVCWASFKINDFCLVLNKNWFCCYAVHTWVTKWAWNGGCCASVWYPFLRMYLWWSLCMLHLHASWEVL